MTELRYTIEERRICWPNPDATCLNGGCIWCDTHPFRKLSTIERYARKAGVLQHRGTGSDDAVHAYRYGQLHNFFNVQTRTSRENLAAYGETVGADALKKMAEGMPGGTHARKKEDVLTWLLAHRRWMLDESFRRTHQAQVDSR